MAILVEQKSQPASYLAEIIALFAFLAFSLWWAVLFVGYRGEIIQQNLLWGAFYQLVAWWGVVWGFLIGRLWGGFKSVMGRTILFFVIGLLLQAFGQSTFSFYNLVLQVDIPYPSISDIGFFGSIPFYIYGIILLGKASGLSISLRGFKNKIWAAVIPLVMLFLSYLFFLRNYEFAGTSSLQVFLDFAYPLGQAVYVAIAILIYILSRKTLGGVMKNKVLLILAALVVQYVADYNFLYQSLNETWVNGGYGDYIYLCAYFLMALGLIRLGSIFRDRQG